jgi:hypothetical protein
MFVGIALLLLGIKMPVIPHHPIAGDGKTQPPPKRIFTTSQFTILDLLLLASDLDLHLGNLNNPI